MLLGLVFLVLCLGMLVLVVWPARAGQAGFVTLLAAGLTAAALGVIALARGALEAGPSALLPWIHLRVDPLSGLFLIACAVALPFASHAAPGTVREQGRLLLHGGALVLVLLAADWVTFLAAWEVVMLTGYSFRTRPGAYGAIIHGGGAALLVPAAALSFIGGASSFAASAGALEFLMTHDAVMAHLLIGLFVLGFVTCAGAWLLGQWFAPDAPQQPASLTVLISGVYGLVRVLAPLGAGALGWGGVLLLGAVGVAAAHVRGSGQAATRI